MSTFTLRDPEDIGVAILGAGRMGKTHIRTCAGIRNARVVVVADPDLAAAEAGKSIAGRSGRRPTRSTRSRIPPWTRS